MKKKNLIAVAALALLISTTGAAQVALQQTPVVSVPGQVASPSSAGVASVPAVPVSEVKSPAAPTNWTDQAIWGLMVSLFMQYLKRARWFTAFSDQSSARVKAVVGFVAAFLTTAGIHFAVNGSVFGETGATVTITGLSFASVKDVLWQWAAQQGWYRMVVKEPKQVTLADETKERP